MDIEIRNIKPKLLEKIWDWEWDILGIGDIGCVYRMPSQNELKDMVKVAIENDKKINFITPIAHQPHLEHILNMIRIVYESVECVDCTINDLGVLSASKELKRDNFNLIIGRILMRVFQECPWHSVIFDDEDNFIKEAFTTKSYEEEKILFLKKLGAKGFESSYFSEISPVLGRLLHAQGLQLRLYLDFALASVGRACHTARFYKLNPPECLSKCEKSTKIKMSKIYNTSTGIPTFDEIPEDSKKYIPEFCVWGNCIFWKTTEEMDSNITNYANSVILDARQYSNEELKQKIEFIRTL